MDEAHREYTPSVTSTTTIPPEDLRYGVAAIMIFSRDVKTTGLFFLLSLALFASSMYSNTRYYLLSLQLI